MSEDQRDSIESSTSTAVSDSGSPVKTEPAATLCPYCGSITPTGARCSHCRGLLDPLSRQATTNTMGPWFVRDEAQPFRPGCSYHTLVSLIDRGKVTRRTIIRGPSTRQFWMFAGKVPGVAHLLGVCHNCQEEANADDFACNNCGAVFTAEEDRQRLGLGPLMEVPGQSLPESKPTPARSSAAHAPRGQASPAAPMIAISDDAAAWGTPPRKSSGMLVGGVVLTIAALAAAGYAVKTWLDANRPPVPEPARIAEPTFVEPTTGAADSLSQPPASTPEQTPAATTPDPGAQPAPSAQPASAPASAQAESVGVAWIAAWRDARGLP